MDRSRSTCPSPGRRGGFTLVELLVVIGIIALLISILLPSLQSARRQANSVKCLSSLRQIGQAFELYANDYKGAWPSTRDRVQTKAADQHSWTDLIARYMTKQNFKNGYQSISDIRRNSVMWGCPEWTRSFDYDGGAGSASSVNVYTGYGMQYYPDSDGYFLRADTKMLASSSGTAGNYTRSGYVKAVIWKRKGSERLLVADSRWDQLWASNDPFTSATLYQPFDPEAFTAPGIAIDARHMKPGTPKTTASSAKCVNVLFCDGHASTVSPKEAHAAVRSPGREKLPIDP